MAPLPAPRRPAHPRVSRLARWLTTLAALALATAPAHALRIVTYNLHEYPQTNGSVRHPVLRTVVAGFDADVLIVQELSSQVGADSVLYNVLQVAEPSKAWRSAGFISTTESAVYYDSLEVGITNLSSFATAGPRDVLLCIVTPKGYAATSATLRLYSVHYKAGNPSITPADSTTRRLECIDIRNRLNLAPANTNLLVGGDTNFYGDWEGGYIRLLENQTDNDGRLKDLVSLPGTWNNFAYAAYHSQSPCATGCATNFAGGGMDDRFDFFLSSYPLQDGEGLDFIQNIPYGNDGAHYNTDINAGGNAAVGQTIANALHDASDHLPVVAILQVPAKVVAASQLSLGTAIVGGAPSQSLGVSNGAVAPADELTYSLIAPAGFGAPGGTFTANVGAGANAHSITMSTGSAGAKSGTLTVSSDDPDSAAKSVALSGTVLRHAVASLDSLATITSDTLDLGGRTAGNFVLDLPARVFNRGYDALQARLAVNAANVTGGGGRFSIVGGFSPALVSGAAASFPIHFDDTGATLDSTYQATLTFTNADEPLPGAAAASGLSVTLVARVVSGTVSVEATGGALRFLAPRPNPLTRATRFAFELPRAQAVSLEVFDLSGRRVSTVLREDRGAGHHEAAWEARDASGGRLPAGLYFARFTTAGLARTERLVLLP